MNRQRVTYTPTGGVCSKMMIVDSEDNVIKNVQIIGGCQGNTQGLSKLLVGMEIGEAIRRLEGFDCRERGIVHTDGYAFISALVHPEYYALIKASVIYAFA